METGTSSSWLGAWELRIGGAHENLIGAEAAALFAVVVAACCGLMLERGGSLGLMLFYLLGFVLLEGDIGKTDYNCSGNCAYCTYDVFLLLFLFSFGAVGCRSRFGGFRGSFFDAFTVYDFGQVLI